MNTVKKGDEFEEKCHYLLFKAIDNYDLSVVPSHCKVYKKKKYYSEKRKEDIIFDLTIEVQSPNSIRPTFLFIVECKDYSSKSIPVDDLEEFDTKIEGIKDVQTKGVFISNNGFQSGAINVAKSMGMMLIEVNNDDYSIILHKSSNKNSSKEYNTIENELCLKIKETLMPSKVEGLKRLSSKGINKIALNFSKRINYQKVVDYVPISMNEIVDFLDKKEGISVDFVDDLMNNKSEELLGSYNLKEKKILINSSIKDTVRFSFVLSHEIGHYVLHRDLKMNQEIYDNFKDSELNFITNRHDLINDRNWIEWQANKFASCLLMPEKIFKASLVCLVV